MFTRRLDRARQLTRDAGGNVLLATSGATNLVRDVLRTTPSTVPAIVIEPKTDYWAAIAVSTAVTEF